MQASFSFHLPPGGCFKKILDAGFDGVYLDIIDAYWYFEERYE